MKTHSIISSARGIGLLLTAGFLVSMPLFGQVAEDYAISSLRKTFESDFDGAIADATKAIELQPNYARAYFYRAQAKKFKGDWDSAIADYTKNTEIKSSDPALSADKTNYASSYSVLGNARASRGAVKRERRDFEAAIADYSKAIEINPNHADAYLNRGCLHYDLQKYADSLADFRKANAMSPGFDYWHFWVWLARQRLGERDAADKELQQYLDNRKAGNTDAWALAVGNFLAGRMTEADFFKYKDTNGGRTKTVLDCEAFFYAGTKRLISGDKTTATDYMKKAVASGEFGEREYITATAELMLLDSIPSESQKAK